MGVGEIGEIRERGAISALGAGFLLAGAHEAGFLSFLHAGVAGHVAFFAKDGAELWVDLNKGPGNGQGGCPQLAGRAGAGDNDGCYEAAHGVGGAIDFRIEGLREGTGEIGFNRLAVDIDVAFFQLFTGDGDFLVRKIETGAGGGGFSAASPKKVAPVRFGGCGRFG
ncbi:MAG: hypothetical protein UY21_C0019G0016 [Microgenomates group bacterium GW2011_GWA1_48_10]|nr:MAG: hypothetical protein UY21_C0019G0016 [Microgenomates group bacterium GW2011_GWA1_48_10]